MPTNIYKIYTETYFLYDALANLQWQDDMKTALELKAIADRRINMAKLVHDKRIVVDDIDLSSIELDKTKERTIRIIEVIDDNLAARLTARKDNESKMMAAGILKDKERMKALTGEKKLKKKIIQCQNCGAVEEYITPNCRVCGAEYNKIAEA